MKIEKIYIPVVPTVEFKVNRSTFLDQAVDLDLHREKEEQSFKEDNHPPTDPKHEQPSAKKSGGSHSHLDIVV